MFKCIAGGMLFYLSVVCYQNGSIQSAEIALFLAIFAMATGLDSIFFDK